MLLLCADLNSKLQAMVILCLDLQYVVLQLLFANTAGAKRSTHDVRL